MSEITLDRLRYWLRLDAPGGAPSYLGGEEFRDILELAISALLQNHDDGDALAQAGNELRRARRLFPKFNSAHEGFAVLKEEVDELWDEVRRKGSDKASMRKEAIQVAAMAIRFVDDVCDRTTPAEGGERASEERHGKGAEATAMIALRERDSALAARDEAREGAIEEAAQLCDAGADAQRNNGDERGLVALLAMAACVRQLSSTPTTTATDHKIGQSVLDAIMAGGLLRTECPTCKHHGLLHVWSGNAQEQLGAAARSATNGK